MKEKIIQHKKLLLIILTILIVVGITIGIIIGAKKTDKIKENDEEIVEKNSIEPEDINVNDTAETNNENTKPSEFKTLADYDGYWFNINDLKDYVAIHDIKDRDLTFDIFLYRLYSMEKIKVTLDCDNQSKFKYKDSGITVEGVIKVNNQEINIEISKSNFEYIKSGEKYKFNVQMKKQAFEEHMLKLAEAENNN